MLKMRPLVFIGIHPVRNAPGYFQQIITDPFLGMKFIFDKQALRYGT